MKHIIFTYIALITLAWIPASGAQEPRPAAAPPGVDLAEAAQRNPAVAAVLDAPRETPGDALAAVFTLLDLRQFEIAGAVLEPVIEADLSAAEQAALGRRFGSARFLLLAREAREHDIAGAREFAQSVLDATAAEAANPATLNETISHLLSDDPAARQAARNDLAATGMPAVVAVLERLAASTDKTDRTRLLTALVEASPVADPVVIAALADGQGQFRRDMAELAGHLRLLEAVPWLATIAAGGDAGAPVVTAAQTALMRMGLPMPDYHDALATVRRELERIDAGIPTDSLPNETGLWWSYDPDAKKFASVELINCERRSLIHARVAANLLVLPNATPADRQLAIISAVEAAHILGEPPAPHVAQLAAALPTSDLNASLAAAIETERFNAAIACAKLLAERADPAALSSLDGLSTPLARAVAHPHSELKFAALTAIMAINPAQSFPGASYVPTALWEFAAGAGVQQAVVAAPNPNHANNWAGNLRSLGYEAIPTYNGINLVRQALASPRIALILVDSEINSPPVREVVYQVRAQPRLAHTPLAVLLANSDIPLGRHLAAVDTRLLAVSRPRSAEAMESIVERLMALNGMRSTEADRTARARQAIEWLGELFAADLPYDELRRDAEILEQTVHNPDLAQVSLAALAHVGTAGSQRTLVDFVNNEAQPMELRQLAADAFATNRERYGVLLTADEIVTQYDRYNASEAASVEVQALLGRVLDILEKKL